MENDAAGTATAAQPPPDGVAQHFAADIYALHHRLHRCLVQAQAAAAAPHESGRHATVSIRRLGDLLRSARLLEERIAQEAHSLKTAAQPAAEEAATEAEGSSTDAPLRAFYRLQLQARLAQLHQDASAAQRLLSAYLRETPGLAHLPVSCIGTAPRALEGGAAAASAAVRQTYCVYTEVVAAHAARISPPVAHAVAGADGDERAREARSSSASRRPVGKQEQRAPAKVPAPLSEPRTASAASAPAAPAPTAEDRIMADIQQAIHQMKDGALQMGALMAQEKSQMQSAAELLSGGVAKSQANMKELNRVAEVAAQTRVPWVLARVPGMPILWRTVLQPMWAFLKQMLLMAAVLAVTGVVLLVISALPKPTVYRGLPRIHAAVEPHVTPPPAPPPVAAAAPATTASPAPAATATSAAPAAPVKEQERPQKPTNRPPPVAQAKPPPVVASVTEEVTNRTPDATPGLTGTATDERDAGGDL